MFNKSCFTFFKIASIVFALTVLCGMMMNITGVIIIGALGFALLSVWVYLTIDSFMAGMDAKDTMLELNTEEIVRLKLKIKELEEK